MDGDRFATDRPSPEPRRHGRSYPGSRRTIGETPPNFRVRANPDLCSVEVGHVLPRQQILRRDVVQLQPDAREREALPFPHRRDDDALPDVPAPESRLPGSVLLRDLHRERPPVEARRRFKPPLLFDPLHQLVVVEKPVAPVLPDIAPAGVPPARWPRGSCRQAPDCCPCGFIRMVKPSCSK